MTNGRAAGSRVRQTRTRQNVRTIAGLHHSDARDTGHQRAMGAGPATVRPDTVEASDDAPASLFGVAAGLVDRLDLWLAARMRRQTWRKIW